MAVEGARDRPRRRNCGGTLLVWLVLLLGLPTSHLLVFASGADASPVPTGNGHRVHRRTKRGAARKHRAARAAKQQQASASVAVVETDSALSEHLTALPSLAFSATPPASLPVIDVNPQQRYQLFAGLGAAMTDSSAWLIYDQISPVARITLMQDLFGAAGIHLNFLRVPMGASDFTVSAQPYSYDDVPAGQSDPSLASFSIAHDLAYIIPTLRQALAVDPGLELVANPWSPPAWMKANGSLDNPGGLGTLLPSAYEPLAEYFVKFLEAYASYGVPIGAITPQNEPSSGGGGTGYPGLTLPEAAEAQFIAQDLAPALSAAGLHTKIYGSDLSWSSLTYAGALTSGPAGPELSGMSWHCYFGAPTVMSQLHQQDPGLDQIVNECSPEIRSFGAPEFLISSLRNWASAVAVWNVALNPQGGPKETPNGCPGCQGLVSVNQGAHNFSFGSEYYQLGQLSSFVHPGATRIDSPNFVTYGVSTGNVETITAGLDDVAFLNPDGSEVLVAYNNSSAAIPFAVQSGGSYFSYTIPPQAMTTFTWP